MRRKIIGQRLQPCEVRKMAESNSNNTKEMAHLDVAPERQEAFLDAEPLVDVDSLSYQQSERKLSFSSAIPASHQ